MAPASVLATTGVGDCEVVQVLYLATTGIGQNCFRRCDSWRILANTGVEDGQFSCKSFARRSKEIQYFLEWLQIPEI